MRINQGAGARTLPYDRVGLQAPQNANVTVGPAGDTVRWTYTAPALRKAIIECVSMFQRRETAATTPGHVSCFLQLRPNGVGFFPFAEQGSESNVVGNVVTAGLGTCGSLLPGDSVEAHTTDASTAGTNFFDLNGHFMEFAI